MKNKLTAIYIYGCDECKDCHSSRTPTEDSFEVAWDYYCHYGSPKKIALYVDWHEKMPPVPKWCKRRKK